MISVIETSMMMALHPEFVDLEKAAHDGPARFLPYERYPRPFDEVPASGVLPLTEGSAATGLPQGWHCRRRGPQIQLREAP